MRPSEDFDSEAGMHDGAPHRIHQRPAGGQASAAIDYQERLPLCHNPISQLFNANYCRMISQSSDSGNREG
jgi:hypothetical protein